MLVGELYGLIDVLHDAVRLQRCLREQSTKGFGGEAYVVDLFRIDACDQRPGQFFSCVGAHLLGVGMGRDEQALPLLRAWIIGVARREFSQYPVYLSWQRSSALPGGVLDNGPRCIAVEAGIVGERCNDMFGLVRQVAPAPRTRYDDDRADAAQFARDALVQQPPILRLALRRSEEHTSEL